MAGASPIDAPAPAPAARVPVPVPGLAPRMRQLLSDYAELTKPKVQSLLLLTTIATMYVAGDPSPLLVGLTCLGGYLSAACSPRCRWWSSPWRSTRSRPACPSPAFWGTCSCTRSG